MATEQEKEAEKSRYHHGDLKEALVDAGEALLADVGLSDFTLRGCARRAGVSHAAPKHHFGDARGLLTAIGARGFRRLTEALETEIRQATSLDEEFVATSRAYLKFAENYPEHFRIMFRHDMLDMTNWDFYVEVGTTLTVLTNVILRQRGEPEITIEQLNEYVGRTEELVADIVIGWSHVHGLAHLRTEQQLGMMDSYSEMLDRAAVRIARMLRTEAGND